MKIAIYARVSTQEQHTDNQLEVLRKWAKDMGGEVSEYVENISGAKSDRPELTRLLGDAHKRKFDVLLIWALDRLSRGGIATLSGLLERLKSSNVRVLSHEEPWLDTKGPVADLLIAIFGWIAKIERDRISERVKAGLGRAKRNGKQLGRPVIKLNALIIKQMATNGQSIRSIAKSMGESKSVVARALK